MGVGDAVIVDDVLGVALTDTVLLPVPDAVFVGDTVIVAEALAHTEGELLSDGESDEVGDCDSDAVGV